MGRNAIYQQLTVTCKAVEDISKIVAAFEVFKANLWREKFNVNLVSYYENNSFSADRVLIERNRQAFEKSFCWFQSDYDNSLVISAKGENYFDILRFVEENKDVISRFKAKGINKFRR